MKTHGQRPRSNYQHRAPPGRCRYLTVRCLHDPQRLHCSSHPAWWHRIGAILFHDSQAAPVSGDPIMHAVMACGLCRSPSLVMGGACAELDDIATVHDLPPQKPSPDPSVLWPYGQQQAGHARADKLAQRHVATRAGQLLLSPYRTCSAGLLQSYSFWTTVAVGGPPASASCCQGPAALARVRASAPR